MAQLPRPQPLEPPEQLLHSWVLSGTHTPELGGTGSVPGVPHTAWVGEAAGSSTHRAEHPQHPQPRARLFPALGTALVGFHLSFFWVSDQQCPLLQLRGTNQQHQGFPAPRAAPLEVSGLALSLCVGQEPAELLAVQLPETFQACHEPPLCHDHPPK